MRYFNIFHHVFNIYAKSKIEGNVGVISSDPPLVEGHVRLTLNLKGRQCWNYQYSELRLYLLKPILACCFIQMLIFTF